MGRERGLEGRSDGSHLLDGMKLLPSFFPRLLSICVSKILASIFLYCVLLTASKLGAGVVVASPPPPPRFFCIAVRVARLPTKKK